MTAQQYAVLAPLFRYPDGTFHRRLDEARNAVPDVEAFASAVAGVQLDSLQALYTSTFDFAPSCSPYLGSHVFGDNTPERSRLLVGLRSRGAGSTELPDHVAEVLASAPSLPDDEWRELHQYIVVPALRKMDDLLRSTSNPYRHLIAAALSQGGES
jgi:nitrate reductase assembly molybdenum cofactor insertion protein NarJ